MAIAKLLQTMTDRVAKLSAGSASAAAETMKRAVAIHGSLRGIQEPIAKRAAEEQRNGAWLKENVAKAYAGKFAEIARLRHQNNLARQRHEQNKPKLPEFDRTDVFAAMETMELAKRVAATTGPMKRLNLSPMEKIAALRMPEIAGLSPSQADAWGNDILKSLEPARMQAHAESAEALSEADRAIDIVKLAFQREAGFVDGDGFPSPQWRSYEHEQLKILQSEFETA